MKGEFTTEAQRTQRKSNLSFAGRCRQIKGWPQPAAGNGSQGECDFGACLKLGCPI